MRKLDRPRIAVDLNEMVDQDVVLLAKDDEVVDSDGNRVVLKKGLRLFLYMDDADENGYPRYILASGVVETNDATDWSRNVLWRCRIDEWGEMIG